MFRPHPQLPCSGIAGQIFEQDDDISFLFLTLGSGLTRWCRKLAQKDPRSDCQLAQAGASRAGLLREYPSWTASRIELLHLVLGKQLESIDIRNIPCVQRKP